MGRGARIAVLGTVALVCGGVYIWYSMRPDSIESIMDKRPCGRRVHIRGTVTETEHGGTGSYSIIDSLGERGRIFVVPADSCDFPEPFRTYDVFGIVECDQKSVPEVHEFKRIHLPAIW